MADEQRVADLIEEAPRGFSVAFAVFFFAFGIAAGFLLAFTGLGFLEDSAGVIAGVFLGTILITAAVGLALLLFRRRILRALFGMAEVQVEQLAAPLAEVAQGIALRDPEAAVGSANRLIRAVMARYAWLSTRRWIMTSLTALIAAMAALAGTALLFKQNALLGEQIGLMAVQNERLDNQNALMARQTELLQRQIDLTEQQTDLAEAARNAAQAGEVAAVIALISDAADRLPPGTALSAETLGRGLVNRIVLTAQGVRPYRFLVMGLTSDVDDQGRMAMLARREVMPQQWEGFAQRFGWSDEIETQGLIDRPGSPERGHLLRALLRNGVRDLAPLFTAGLDLSFAYAREARMDGVTFGMARLTLADLSRSWIRDTDFSQAVLANVRFSLAEMIAVDFGHAGAAGDGAYADLTGADFTDGALVDCTFVNAYGFASVFDRAVLVAPDFTGATLVAASFRAAVLIAPDWQGANLHLADFDGAYVFGQDPLAEIAASATGFDPALYRAEPIAIDEAAAVSRWVYNDREGIEARVGAVPAWRLVRIADFD